MGLCSYNYPAHNALRESWMHYLPHTLAQSDDHVFYLAGTENLEIDGYLAKGLTPRQLHSAEHDPSRFHTVCANSNGVHITQGGIKLAIEEMESSGVTTLRGAWLDLEGNSHSYTEELLALSRLMPSQDGSCLALTSYAARDRMALVQGTVNACKFYSGLPSSGCFLSQYGAMMHQYEHALKLLPTGESSALAHFQREMGFLWWLVLMFGATNRNENSPLWQLDNKFLVDSDDVLRQITNDVQQRLTTQPAETDLVFVLNTQLRDLLSQRRVSTWITHLRRYAFWSMKRQPMRTWFAKIVPYPLDEEPPTMQELLLQVWTLACQTPLVILDEEGKSITIT